MKVIITGNPVDGLKFFGPYPDDTEWDALDVAVHCDGEWWLADITPPPALGNQPGYVITGARR